MLERKWFVYTDGKVIGPLQEEQLKLNAFPNSLCWTRGRPDWFAIELLPQILNEMVDFDKKRSQPAERMWKIKLRGKELPRVFNHNQLIETLKIQTDMKEVLLWTEGYNEWKQVFEIHKIMDDLGVSRRAHPRVPINGAAILEGNTQNLTGKALSISEGGLGVTDINGVKIGERYRVTLKSPNLFAAIYASAEVVYVGKDGYVGMKFLGLQSETRSSIIEYVKKFSDVNTQSKISKN